METVIFDMDGVIINSEPIHYKLLSQIFNDLGISLSKEEYYSFVGTSSRNMWQTIVEKHQLSLSVEELLSKGKEKYFTYMRSQDSISPIPGIEQLLKEAGEMNKNIILASSSSMENIELVLDILKLEHHFDHKISGAELKHSKPHPEIFLKAAGKSGTNPELCLVIEDSKNGVEAAKAAGMKCIGYSNPDSGYQDLSSADWVYKNLTDIKLREIKKFFNSN